MARPAVIRDETIIEAARAVFLERGFRATTAEVAQRAGISEGSIFKRFRSKDELFEAAMGGAALEDPPVLRHIEAAAGQGDLGQQLRLIALELVEYLRTIIPLTMMQWSNPQLAGDAPPCLRGDDSAPLRLLRAMVRYFAAEMAAGRLRSHDPEIVAQAFMGALRDHVVMQLLYAGQHRTLPTPEFVDGLLRLALEGIDPGRRGRRPARLSEEDSHGEAPVSAPHPTPRARAAAPARRPPRKSVR